MKKTLVALTVAALATSASAATIYEKDGTKVDLYGSARFIVEKNVTKEGNAKAKGHTTLHNNGSRLGFKINHMVSDDVYALGEVEARFNGSTLKAEKVTVKVIKEEANQEEKKALHTVTPTSTTDAFGNLYIDSAFVGLGSKTLGEVTFGRRGTIGGDIAQSAFSKKYDKFEGLLADSGKAVVRYDYKGIEGLTASVDYRFAEEREGGEVVEGKLKSGYGAGFIYENKMSGVTFAAGYTRDNNLVKMNKAKHYKDAYGIGASFSQSDVTVAADLVASYENQKGDKTLINGFRLGVKFAVTPSVDVFANYGHGKETAKKMDMTANTNTVKKTIKTVDGLLFGTSYKVFKNVDTYAQLGYHVTKTKGEANKQRHLDAGVGLNVSF